MRKRGSDASVLAVQRWFRESVTYEGEPYTIDYEQAAAVADESLNTIVVARAGSGKTRTLVAKIVYLVAVRGVKPDEIMAFVFNANAAKEINERLSKMRVNGEAVIGGENDAIWRGSNGGMVRISNNVQEKVDGATRGTGSTTRIASTFHAFARKIVYQVCKGEKRCGKILASEKEAYILEIVRRMVDEAKWRAKIVWFMKGQGESKPAGERGRVISDAVKLDEEELVRLAAMMVQFVNRAQQKYLGGEVTVREVAEDYLRGEEVAEREKAFVELGVEVFRRYHWYLLDAKRGLDGFQEYGTDFNLIVSWASRLIASGREEVVKLLGGKKYILIDEYQDFSQLFLAAVGAIRMVAGSARLFVVGDDWQAINRFAGSEVEYFKEFEKIFPDGVRRCEITTNYRCDREVVEKARKFMAKAMGEKGEFRAFSRRMGKVMVVDPRVTECELPLVKYDRRVSGRDAVYAEMARKMLGREPKRKTVRYVKTVVELMRANWKAQEIMLLHRNNEMNLEGMSLVGLTRGLKWGLERMGVMSAEEFDAKVRVMTMHKSKGLEAEVVIILEADEGVIPKLHPDTLLYGMFGETLNVALDDQKRLFYVAMTRAKRRLYIIHDGSSGAGFVKYLGRGVERWGE
ncbi:ATP-dependent helicase [Candidatus Saccharibacteria bacterium]|nr:ATP-dependent helicase [Candidatus Saccharibacteria bacterium]